MSKDEIKVAVEIMGSQQAIADATGIPKSSISRMRSGERPITRDAATTIRAAVTAAKAKTTASADGDTAPQVLVLDGLVSLSDLAVDATWARVGPITLPEAARASVASLLFPRRRGLSADPLVV